MVKTRASFQLLVLFFFAAGLAVLVWASLSLTDGRLIYTLDDPYIHLAVAESILRGGYGINPGEYASPSSSVIYPLLLTVPIALGVGDWGPLLTAALAGALGVWVLSGHVWRHALAPDGRAAGWAVLAVAPALILVINAIALPMTGMEHSLHVTVSILVIAGLTRLALDGSMPGWLPALVVLCGLIRFEGLALALAAVGAIAWTGRWQTALATLVTIVVVFALYGLAMHRMGLPYLPSSVLVKSEPMGGASDAGAVGMFAGLASNLADSLTSRRGLLVAASLVLVLFGTARRCGPVTLVGYSAAFAIAAHLAFGRYGWFGRYEVYVVAIAVMALALLYRDLLLRVNNLHARGAVVVVALLFLGAHSVFPTVATPAGSRNIYQQQFMMHRFATEFFPRTVAVNDLGWVAYRNDNNVLDLWGLGSEEARVARQEGLTAQVVNRLARRHGAAYAMIYDRWFAGVVPVNWCRMAELRTSWVTTAEGRVAFYSIDAESRSDMAVALRAFRDVLPRGTELVIEGCPTSGTAPASKG